jgi:flavin-dependent dehydrogenase
MVDTNPSAAADARGEDVQDVVICGGGLAGLLLARQIRQELPGLSVTVLEKTRRPLPDACHKVGESSVEAGSQYLERLGLESYLLEHHYVKLGLRFFPGGGHLPLVERLEVGPSAEPVVRSYQLDRGRFESDLRGFLEQDGVTLLEGARVRQVQLGADGELHQVPYEQDDRQGQLRARWFVDATGRAALLRKELKLKRGARHDASAGWFRIQGRFDISDLVPKSEQQWHLRPCADERWRSTNHFMGTGYWVWVIPLATGYTSIGVVVHDEVHGFSTVSSLAAVFAFLREHEPLLADALADADVRDFLCLKNYSHGIARSFSANRWAIVGEAGAFVDPLYSPGTDFIAFANSFTTELLRIDQAGGDLTDKVAVLNTQYRTFVTTTTDLFRTAAPVYGHAQAMTTKIFWDNFTYWSFTCQFFKQKLWTLDREGLEPFNEAGRKFVQYSTYLNAAFRAWAELAPTRNTAIMRPIPVFPSVLVDAHVATGQHMEIDETLAYIRQRAVEGREIVAEFILRIVQELGPELAQDLLERVDFASWEIDITPERLVVEGLDSVSRRHQMSPIARDVERSLGGVQRHAQAERARELLVQGSLA